MCVRAGARVTVVDDGTVGPGILVRQPYADGDIGENKAVALARRLRTLRRGADVHDVPGDAISYLQPGQEARGFELIIDATADVTVRAALEHTRKAAAEQWPPVVTLLIGHHARLGVAAVSRRGATGAGLDVLRRLGLAARGTHAAALGDVANDLYPRTPRTEVFLPEPGCSAPTFVGSYAEVSALSAALITAALDALSGGGPAEAQQPMAAVAVRLDGADVTWLGWRNDVLTLDDSGAYQLRLSRPALATMRAEARRGVRLRGPKVETGGMLLGEIDAAAGVVFVDVATPPPPDSLLSELHFQHGVQGAQEMVTHHHTRSGGITGFVGMWHTHPHRLASPSPTDEAGMANLVTPVADGPRRALMLIIGGDAGEWADWINGHAAADPLSGATPEPVPALYARLVRRGRSGIRPPAPPRPAGRYYPGGWAPVVPDRGGRRGWWYRLWRPTR